MVKEEAKQQSRGRGGGRGGDAFSYKTIFLLDVI